MLMVRLPYQIISENREMREGNTKLKWMYLECSKLYPCYCNLLFVYKLQISYFIGNPEQTTEFLAHALIIN